MTKLLLLCDIAWLCKPLMLHFRPHITVWLITHSLSHWMFICIIKFLSTLFFVKIFEVCVCLLKSVNALWCFYSVVSYVYWPDSEIIIISLLYLICLHVHSHARHSIITTPICMISSSKTKLGCIPSFVVKIHSPKHANQPRHCGPAICWADWSKLLRMRSSCTYTLPED